MRFFGHPLHPMLVHFPVAFFTLAFVGYAARALNFPGPTGAVATASNVIALAMTLPAAVAGLMEWRTLAAGSPALKVATTHMLVMLSAFALFVAALVLPLVKGMDARAAAIAAALCAFAGFGLLSAGGWMGGRLVYEFGVGKVEK